MNQIGGKKIKTMVSTITKKLRTRREISIETISIW